MDEEAHDVLLDVQRVVVLTLPRLDPALAGGVVEGAVALPAALLSAEVVEANRWPTLATEPPLRVVLRPGFSPLPSSEM